MFYSWKKAVDQEKKHIEKLKECIALIDRHEDELLTVTEALDACFNNEAAHQAPLDGERINQLKELSVLLADYPSLDSAAASMDELDAFYQEREAHHANVLSLVEHYLPESYALIYARTSTEIIQEDLR